LIEQMLAAGADIEIPNRAGLRPVDFCQEDGRLAVLFNTPPEEAVDAASHPAFNLGSSRVLQHAQSMAAFESASAVTQEESLHETRSRDLQAQLAQTQKDLNDSRYLTDALSSQVTQLEALQNPQSATTYSIDRVKGLVSQALDIPIVAVDPTLAETLLNAVSAEIQQGRPVSDADLIRYIRSIVQHQQPPPPQ
jgi:hypothetical protein